MLKIIKYSFADLSRSKWTYVYFFFYLALGFVLLFLNTNITKAITTLLNVVIVLTPLIGTIFGIMYYYSSREFTTLLLSQPVRRRAIFLGQYIGVAGSLALSMAIGLGIPFLSYGLMRSGEIKHFIILLIVGIFLSFIFVAIAFNIGLSQDNKIKGFSYAIFIWLLLAVIYDGIFLLLLSYFNDYPIDKAALIGITLNPIDLSRMLILLKLDISALMGYTGAVFKSFFGASKGMILSMLILTAWVLLPAWRITRKSARKDF